MFKKIIKVIGIFLLCGFSFFYTEKATKIIRKKDPIMIKINESKKENYIKTVKPIINDNEYYTGLNGCEVDVDKSYNKMKTIKEFKKELLVMKDINNNVDLKDKYIVGGNKVKKNISIIFLLNDDSNMNLINYLNKRKIKNNYFVKMDFLENNTSLIKMLAENNNIYYYSDDYDDEYMIYSNNLIELNSNNKSNYCLLENKNDDILKICSDYNMKVVKTDFIKKDVFDNVKNKLDNGSIFLFDSDNIDEIKVSINYILSKGYNIVLLDELLNEKSLCK